MGHGTAWRFGRPLGRHLVRRSARRLSDLTTAGTIGLIAARAYGGAPPIAAELVANLDNPIHLTAAASDPARLFVLERAGTVRVILEGNLLPDPFLDISELVLRDSEGGLLGMTFHPEYAENGFFFVHYTRAGSGSDALTSVVARYRVRADDPNEADPSTAQIVITVGQPASHHNAGWIDFGPNDGLLYVALGDGGLGGGPSQDITNELLGKILRLDVDGDDFPSDPDRNYAIPAGNPFVDAIGDDEIWSLGLRNPFRCGFDRDTGDLWIGDVGDAAWEEINFQPASHAGGANYGWGCMEGFACNGASCTCQGPGLTLPVQTYGHTAGCAVMGGTVYRGCAIPGLAGSYFFGDYCSGRVWSLRYDGEQVIELIERTGELGTPFGIVAFGADAAGELYIVTLGGAIWRIVAADPPKKDPCSVTGDVNGDGTVDFADIVLMLSQWGPCEGCPGDVDGSGRVDVADILVVIGNWS